VKPPFDTIQKVEQWLSRVPMFSTSGRSAANFNLERMVLLLSNMGNPHQKFRSVHVGGTNGKGTVCRMLASVYQAAGYKTGLYTSPHLISVWERFKIVGYEADLSKFLPFFNRYGSYLEKEGCTFFEITTAAAFWYFAEENVDIAIVEVGLGGRLDATNVIVPELSAITSIGLDHTEILGNSIESVTFEKAGIIKENRPVVIGNLPKLAENIIYDKAKKKHAEVLKVDPDFFDYEQRSITLKSGAASIIEFDFIGKEIDALNAAMVFIIVNRLKEKYPVDENRFVEGMETYPLKFTKTAAFEKLLPNCTWYFDGAHNEEATSHLVYHLKSIAPPEKWSVVLSYMQDKLTDHIAGQWSDFDKIFLHEMQSERAASMERMRHYFSGGTPLNLHEKNYFHQFETELVIFSGSFYFYHEVSKWLGATNTTG